MIKKFGSMSLEERRLEIENPSDETLQTAYEREEKDRNLTKSTR